MNSTPSFLKAKLGDKVGLSQPGGHKIITFTDFGKSNKSIEY
jgi:hypothetical protein